MPSYSAWRAAGPELAGRRRAACYEDITGRMQAALDHLSAEYPHPVLQGCSRITARAAARAMERARSRRHRQGSRRLPDPVFQAPPLQDSAQGPAPFRVPVGG